MSDLGESEFIRSLVLANRLISRIGMSLHVRVRRLRFGEYLRIGILILLFAVCDSGQGSWAQGTSTPSSEQNRKTEDHSCEHRLKSFVNELDRLLEENPRSIRPLEQLLASSFPVRNCDIEAVRQVTRTSKFFERADDQVSVVVFVFSSERFVGSSGFATRGFYVSFGIGKSTGQSSLPFVKINTLPIAQPLATIVCLSSR
jgi:hypothetical protein